MKPTEGWRPTASWPVLALRARLLAAARQFFADRGVTEVETPALVSHAVSDINLTNMQVVVAGDGTRAAFLHTSPEYHMKRLLAAGAPDIYQICRVFRDGERGRLHEPEFTMVEWYRRSLELGAMIDETLAFVAAIAATAGVNLAAPVRLTYRDAFVREAGLDPLTAALPALRACAGTRLEGQLSATLMAALGDDRNAWLDLLMTHAVQPALARLDLAVIERFPASQAALARLTPGDPRTAERFEVFCRGVEFANGYHELCDPEEQRQRFEADRAGRRLRGFPDVVPDPALLAALTAGLPDCAGVAVGFDRLMLALTGATRLRDVLAFPARSD